MNALPLIRAILILFLTYSTSPAAVSSLEVPSVDRDAAVSYNQWLASSFTADPEAPAVFVNSITVKLNCAAPNQYVFFAITGTAAGRPDMNDIRVIGDTAALAPTVTLNSVIHLTVEPRQDLGPAVLQPGQQYWLVFGVTQPDWDEDLPAGLYHWSYAAGSGGTTAQDGWTVGPVTATGNTAGQNWTPESSTPYSFSITMTPVPEPGFGAFILIAALMLGIRRSSSK